MDILKNTRSLEENLGVKFNNIELLQVAITHSSYANENHIPFNERLEFLGDAVLELVISQYLFKKHRVESEGYLTKVRSLIVCENSLHKVALKWNLGKYMFMSKGEEMTGGRERASILADAVEAVFASIYLDKGIDFATDFIIKSLRDIIEKASKNEIVLDYKTKLQEVLQKNGDVEICYSLTGFEGPPHRRKFFVEVAINGNKEGSGEGFSKKEAEQKAAKVVLIARGEINE